MKNFNVVALFGFLYENFSGSLVMLKSKYISRNISVIVLFVSQSEICQAIDQNTKIWWIYIACVYIC